MYGQIKNKFWYLLIGIIIAPYRVICDSVTACVLININKDLKEANLCPEDDVDIVSDEPEPQHDQPFSATRVFIEQCNGQIKNKFWCLLIGMIIAPYRVICDSVTACCVLININKDLKEANLCPEDDVEIVPDEPEPPHEQHFIAFKSAEELCCKK